MKDLQAEKIYRYTYNEVKQRGKIYEKIWICSVNTFFIISLFFLIGKRVYRMIYRGRFCMSVTRLLIKIACV